jgi:hypothetical protein
VKTSRVVVGERPPTLLEQQPGRAIDVAAVELPLRLR